MARNPFPVTQLDIAIDRTPTEIVVHCTGKINSDTIQQLKAAVKPVLPESPTVLLDLTNVTYLDSSGLGAIVGLYFSAKALKGRLTINLNERLKESFSITRLGQLMAHDLLLP